MVICLEQSANDLHMVWLMPLPPHHLCFRKSEWLSFWYRPTQVVLEKRPLNDCVCVCVCVKQVTIQNIRTKQCNMLHCDKSSALLGCQLPSEAMRSRSCASSRLCRSSNSNSRALYSVHHHQPCHQPHAINFNTNRFLLESAVLNRQLEKNAHDRGQIDRISLTHDPDLESPVSYGHDLLTRKRSRSTVSRFQR